jgi:hypothetical protein
LKNVIQVLEAPFIFIYCQHFELVVTVLVAVRNVFFVSSGVTATRALFAAPCQETASGTWQFWPDGTLELGCPAEDGKVSERIWFAKPNLRLRSSLAHRADGEPGRASFSTEIRRVSRPPSQAL